MLLSRCGSAPTRSSSSSSSVFVQIRHIHCASVFWPEPTELQALDAIETYRHTRAAVDVLLMDGMGYIRSKCVDKHVLCLVSIERVQCRMCK